MPILEALVVSLFGCDGASVPEAFTHAKEGVCRPLKHFIVMLLVDMVNNRFGIKVDKRYKLPKMRYKGDKPIQQVLRKAAPSLIKEVSCP